MIITHKLSLDLQNRELPTSLAMVQCDLDTRAIEISMMSGGAVWIPENVDNVFLRYRKSDGTGGSYDSLPDGTKAWTLEENRVTICVAPQVLTVPGLVEAQAALTCGEGCIATFLFRIVVEEDPSLGIVKSENYVSWSQWAKTELDRLLQTAKESGEFAGICFLPAVDAQGNLSWTNDGGLENPAPVNIADLVAEKLNGGASLGAATADLDMNGYRITALGEPEESSDAANRAFVLTRAKQAAPRNLLDNSDFRNPVNQRGAASYAGAKYGIDRWRGYTSAAAMAVGDGFVTFSSTGSGQSRQYLDVSRIRPAGKTFTIACEDASGNVYCGSGTAPDAVPSSNATICAATVTGATVRLLWNADGALFVQMHTPQTSLSVKWVALYEGKYTADTLPDYRPKGYGAELLECQRYYQIRSANNIAAEDLRPLMRLTSPTITETDGGYAYSADL